VKEKEKDKTLLPHKGRAHTGGRGIAKKPKTWKYLISPLQRNWYRNLKVTEENMRRGSGTSEKDS
jgi:hypothetical protein